MRRAGMRPVESAGGEPGEATMDGVLGSTLGYAAGAVALIVVAGLPPLLAKAATPATAAEGVAHLVRWAVLFATLAFVVPSYKKVFDDFGTRLPFLTELAVRAGDTAFLWMPGLLLVGAAATAAFHRLYLAPQKRPWAKRLSRLMTAAAVAAVLGGSASLLLPLIQIFNDLS